MYEYKDHRRKDLRIKLTAEGSLTHNHHKQECVQSQDPKLHYDRNHPSLDNL